MPNWTEYQKAVISHKGNNLLVSAAAGSGKTAVMIEHIYSQIASGATTVDKLLVATYTNAAAASMKEKLINKLESAFEATGDQNILKQKQMVDRSDISTLHSFCIKTLRKYYYYTPLSPDFRVFSGTQEEMLKDAAIVQVIEEAAKRYNDGDFPEYKDVMMQFSYAKSDDALPLLLKSLNESLCKLPHPEEFKENVLKLYIDKDSAVWTSYIMTYLRDLLKTAIDHLEKVNERYRLTEVGEMCEAYTSKLIDMLSSALHAGSFEEMHTALTQRLASPGKSESHLRQNVINNATVVKIIRTNIKDILKDLKNTDLTHLLPAIKGLFTLHAAFSERFDELMLNEGGTNFDGVLSYTVKLIESNPDILEDMKSNIDYIYIDEYQDINAMQNYIIETLSKGDNMFFVGDIKQSIYGFNYARPDLFKDKMIEYNDSAKGTRINLMNNFRSYPEILEGVNFIFENVMNDADTSEIIYDADASLYPSPDPCSPQHSDCLYLNGKKEPANELLYVDGDLEDEAYAVASRIKELMNATIIDSSSGTMRPVRFNDIAILAKQKKHGKHLEAVFKKFNIPISLQREDNKAKKDSTSTILSLLRLLILRRSDIDLITVLLSNIGGFTPSELSLIRNQNKLSSFYDAFTSYDKKPSITKKIKSFIELLDRLELLEHSMSLSDFIEYLYNETGYIYHSAYLPENSEELKAYNNLVETARSFAEISDGTLRSFLDYYQSAHSSYEENVFSLDENDNSVHFMTIHKSKGLEFPIVFIIGTTTSSDGGDKTYYFNEELGFGFNHYTLDEFEKRTKEVSIARTAIGIKKHKLNIAENMRLLYVALTRARNKLIFSCPIKKEDLNDYYVDFCSAHIKTFINYADIVLPLIFNHRDGAPLREYYNENDYFNDDHIYEDSNWSVKIFGARLDDIETAAEEIIEEKNFDKDAYINKVREAFSWEYPFKAAVTQRTKQSPSKRNTRIKIPLRRPRFEDKEFIGAQKGTVVHFFMEHVSFSSFKGVKEQAEDMLYAGILSQEEYDALPFESIEAFMASDFVKRMRASDEICRERSFCQIVPIEETGDEALIQGIIDCYFFEGENIVLLDYKTDKIHNDLDDHIEHHSRQLKMYKYALEQLYPGKKVIPYIHFFDVDKTVEIK